MSVTSPSPWAVWEITHAPDRPLVSRQQMRERAEELEIYIERLEHRIKHAGTREALAGAERNLAAAERELRELRKKLGSRSIIGSIYGGPTERPIPQGAVDVCQTKGCGAGITAPEAFNSGGYCEECLYLWTHPEARQNHDNTTTH